MILGEL